MIIRAMSGEKAYDILVKRGCLEEASSLLDLERKVLILTDEGVPADYADAVASQCEKAYVMTVEQGEKSKSPEVLLRVLSEMLNKSFSRGDCVVAVGGGVCGDLAGFAASIYMRGVDFYNIPTTVLSQVDSSIGGKTAVNFEGVKNIIGSFYQPKKVLIDADLLKTLPKRQINNGLAEVIKMSLTFDEELFKLFEEGNPYERIEEIIERSLRIKNRVVCEDEKEQGLRRVLNFGHTIGHGIEAAGNGLYHGECVTLGMIPMCSEQVRDRLIKVLKKLGLPVSCSVKAEDIKEAMIHDKKSTESGIRICFVDRVGSYEMRTMTVDEVMQKAGIILEG